MPRVARRITVEDGSTNHCTWRSHCDARVFEVDGARAKFLSLIAKYKEKYGVLVRSYCLMGTHPHVVTTATKGLAAFSSFWMCVNHAFACWYNRRTKGRGQVIRERMQTPRIQDGRHELVVMRYADLNPVRAGLVERAGDWEWSSFRHYAYGELNDLVTDSPEYVALGTDPAARRRAYLHLFSDPLEDHLLSRRGDLVVSPFVGDDAWIAARREESGLPPAPD